MFEGAVVPSAPPAPPPPPLKVKKAPPAPPPPPPEIEEEEEAERKAREGEKKKEKLEELLGGVNTAILDAQATAQADALFSMNYMPVGYYSSIPGGSYADTLKYQDKQLPSNKKGRRIGLAQQLLHEEMVESQYDSKSAK